MLLIINLAILFLTPTYKKTGRGFTPYNKNRRLVCGTFKNNSTAIG